MSTETLNHIMGAERLRGYAVHARYVGNDPLLAGRTALVGRPADGNPYDVVAQFDEATTGKAYGWHRFDSALFASVSRPIPPAAV